MARSTELAEGGVGLISGGLDSTVVAAGMMQKYDRQFFMFAAYGQKTLGRELVAFRALCEHYQPTDSIVVDLGFLPKVGKSALFDSSQPLTALNRKSEYVPFRNAILLGAAVAWAETVSAGGVLIGSTGGDRTCPDNSTAFINAFQAVVNEGTMTDRPINVVAPLIELDKAGVIKRGLELNAPFELSWSCHNNLGSIACGACSNCEARRGSYVSLGLEDPIQYE